MGKWIWRFIVEENSFWKSHISTKYGIEAGGWFTKDPKGSYGVGLWKAITKEKAQVNKDCALILGNCRRIRF